MIKMTYDKATAIRIRDYLLSKGLTLEGTYGMMANIYTESGFRSNNAQNSYMNKMGMTDEEYTAKIDSGEYANFVLDKVGYGLAQWTSSGRKQGIFNYAKSLNKSIGDENMQLDYLMIELTTAYKSVLNFLKSSRDVRESAKYVMTKFERPANQSKSAQNKRADYGEQLYEDLENAKGSDNMGYTNSPLVDYVKISPNSTNPRNNKIKKITIHHMAGNLSVEACGDGFANRSRKASSNYGIGTDGRIGLYVEEKNRSWCSSSANNDNQAVTIEVANDTIGKNWHVSDKALVSLIDLCTDICKRNGIKELNFTGNKNGNLTMHRYFAATACPGDYLASKFPYIAEEVNKRLNPISTTPSPTIFVNQFAPLKGNPTHFAEIIKNIKLALNTDYGLAFTIDSGINDILLINLANVVLSTSVYKPNITYALQQLFVWWGYALAMDGIYGNGTKSTVALFQSQVGISQTGTTTKEFWYKILGK